MNIRLPDFDVLTAIHRQDPEALEHFRRHLLREAVNAAPPAHRPSLEQLLSRIERERQAAANPMEAMMIAFRMMSESLDRLHHGWDQALQSVAELQAALIVERFRLDRGYRAPGAL